MSTDLFGILWLCIAMVCLWPIGGWDLFVWQRSTCYHRADTSPISRSTKLTCIRATSRHQISCTFFATRQPQRSEENVMGSLPAPGLHMRLLSSFREANCLHVSQDLFFQFRICFDRADVFFHVFSFVHTMLPGMCGWFFCRPCLKSLCGAEMFGAFFVFRLPDWFFIFQMCRQTHVMRLCFRWIACVSGENL